MPDPTPPGSNTGSTPGSPTEPSTETPSTPPSDQSQPDQVWEAKKDKIFDDKTFADLGLRKSICESVAKMGFTNPTDIQAQLIPLILSGKDVIGQAKTGTGKTAAFGLPILHMADKDTRMQALILVPTRELASQVTGELEDLGRFTPIKSTCIIGGESMRDQSESIKRGGHIIVGTPGRIMDMRDRGQIHFRDLKFAVLDEVDRMLDIGFRDDIRKILGGIEGDHQTIFVSATIEDEIERLARRYMKKDAEKIICVSGSLTVSLVDQQYIPVQPWDKRSLLLKLIKQEKPDTTVVFCKTKATVDKLYRYLSDKNVQARSIHGNMPQNKRTRVMDSMRSGKTDVLIASDLAARGLDIDHITHVINYDLPEDPEVYVHRVGRTARAGRRGVAWSFVTPEEGGRLTDIEKLTGVMVEQRELPDGWTPGPVPRDVVAVTHVAKERTTESATDIAAKRLKERTEASALDGYTEEQLKAMFPDGKIPKSLPKRTLGSRLRTKRGR